MAAAAKSEIGAASKGEQTRAAILERAVDLASIEGLEGLTIGRLAAELRMSKSGLFAHFGSKQELQLATVAAAGERFRADVIEPPFDTDTNRHDSLLRACERGNEPPLAAPKGL